MKKTVGILFADSMEYAPFLNYAKKQKGAVEGVSRGNNTVKFTMVNDDKELEIVAVECGVGKVNAAASTAFLIAENHVDWILNAGLSGAISGVKREDFVAGESYIECDFDLRAIGYDLAIKPDGEEYIHYSDAKLLSYAKKIDGMKSGRLGTGDIFLADSEKKQLFKQLFELTAFDMETAAIAAVCKKSDVPMLSVRKISDDADDTAKDDYPEMNNRAEACLTEVMVKIFDEILSDETNW
ncbi:MAG: 5'-methylthioadenosine/S-adenosylhomocysteine nucleosidase [Faecalibacterium sp.]|nr:5'-methylthioadenosine/S-adenosylhomocysteine nucleosidase [Ruminococcus sp.]MCM1391437.1 5'-methylthioadenosine/S-adenosylhomocysteine nucleosidase [Ruminococcus sp.]MCM1485248.1 5'-methylthioadenosine/S-adenosylhomocysteine nucleosidase [Faecalibacterium sp.]